MITPLLLAAALQSQAIGGYSAGCLRGAQALPLTGSGYEVIRTERARYFGHPSLIDYLTHLSRAAHRAGLPTLYIGDMAMQRGGPFSSGHRSHQSGLDADIWFRMGNRPIKASEKGDPAEWPLVDESAYKMLPGRFGHAQLTLLRLAASAPEVDRIFVHPVIKQAVCQQAPKAAWVQKLRPWVGHFSHFHVRLHCPAGSTLCVPQAPIPSGNGCGEELTSWLKDKPRLPKTPSKALPMPTLPAACR